MKFMLKILKYSIFFFVAFYLHDHSAVADGNESETPAACRSYISIRGSSNVNKFQFHNDNPQAATTPERWSESNLIRIPVYDFNASNKHMLNDFYDLVNATKHPFIEIAIEPRSTADFDEQSGLTNFRTEVTIAGQSNTYIVPSTISGCEHRGFMLEGDLKIKLTDFKIEPPTKLLGAVKVNDEVFIKFAFRMQHEEQLTEQLTE
jgi:hypothetical protein